MPSCASLLLSAGVDEPTNRPLTHPGVTPLPRGDSALAGQPHLPRRSS